MRILIVWLITLASLPSNADEVAIGNTGVRLTAIAPVNWSRQPPGTGNSRIKFSAPQGTPYAECAVIAQEIPGLRGQPQSYYDQFMLGPIDSQELAQTLSASFNNVRILSTTRSMLSGHPAQLAGVAYSVGVQSRQVWARGFHLSAGTPPGISWTVSCGAIGKTAQDAENGYAYWQSEFVKFPTFIRIAN